MSDNDIYVHSYVYFITAGHYFTVYYVFPNFVERNDTVTPTPSTTATSSMMVTSSVTSATSTSPTPTGNTGTLLHIAIAKLGKGPKRTGSGNPVVTNQ